MLNLGKNLTSSQDILQNVKIDSVYKATINESGEVATLIRRLQSIRMIDENQYRKMKTRLPYLVCAQFHPNIRRKENFLYTEYFILDLDHLLAYQIDIDTIRNKLKEDNRVLFMYTSPSGDGLKVFFKLKERISDSSYYSIFYKAFANKFAAQYGLMGIVDLKTHDVSRCCFVSFDKKAYLNLGAEPVDAATYMFTDDIERKKEQQLELKDIEKEIKEEHKELGIKPDTKDIPLSDEILNQIRQKVGVRTKRKVQKKNYVQPAELDKIIPELTRELKDIDVSLVEAKAISYGRQIRVKAGQYWAEINVFYGKNGVNIVKTTKTGSHLELCNLVSEFLINKFQNKIFD